VIQDTEGRTDRLTERKMAASRDTAPCSLVEGEGHFGYAYCFHHQNDDNAPTEAVSTLKRRSTSTGLYDAIWQKAVIFILATART
jgi:hypothetical protein